MRACGIVETLGRILPFKAWRGNLLERHIGRCPACGSRLAPREDAGAYVVSSGSSVRTDMIWPAVEARIRTMRPASGRRADRQRGLWKPITAISALAGALLLIFIVTKPPRPTEVPRSLAPLEDFRLDSVEAWGRPAQALVYQAGDPRTTIIWVR
jgi:hypothetical protein